MLDVLREVVQAAVVFVFRLRPPKRDAGDEDGDEAIAFQQFGEAVGEEDPGHGEDAGLCLGEGVLARVFEQQEGQEAADQETADCADDYAVGDIAPEPVEQRRDVQTASGGDGHGEIHEGKSEPVI